MTPTEIAAAIRAWPALRAFPGLLEQIAYLEGVREGHIEAFNGFRKSLDAWHTRIHAKL